MRKISVFLLAVLVLLLFTVSSLGLEVYNFAPRIPSKPLTTEIHVQDYAKMLSSSSKAEINKTALALKQQTKAEIVIVTIESLEENTIEEYANKLFVEWGIGDSQLNNGVLLLVSKGDRKFRIEVGYGLEGVITDGKSGRILDQMIPYFRDDKYNEGILLGYGLILKEVCSEYNINIEDILKDSKYIKGALDKPDFGTFKTILIIIAVIIYVFITRRRGPGGGYRGGYGGYGRGFSSRTGTFGGGGGFSRGGGGGRSGGGGASRGW